MRLASNRSSAQALAERGIVRINGRRIERAHSGVRIGDLITVPQGNCVYVIRVASLPVRRGPAVEARKCYDMVMPGDELVPEADQGDAGTTRS